LQNFLYGIQGKLLAWLRCFYSNRTHQTKVGQSLSSVLDLISGVVQGSGIGPIMFVCFINELIDILKKHGVKVRLFADDVKIYASVVNDIDNIKLQQAVLLVNAVS
jgi:hypothetical protein